MNEEFVIPFDIFEEAFGEAVLVDGTPQRGILTINSALEYGDTTYEVTTLDIQGYIPDLPSGALVVARGVTYNIERKVKETNPQWSHYVLSRT